MESVVILIISGIACQAFKSFDEICQEYGNLTLGELAEDRFDYGYWEGKWLSV